MSDVKVNGLQNLITLQNVTILHFANQTSHFSQILKMCNIKRSTRRCAPNLLKLGSDTNAESYTLHINNQNIQ